MKDHKFEIGRHVFVSGLHWQPLNGSYAEARREVKHLGAEMNFDLMVSRTTGAPQVGFASTRDGYKAGMFSAAAVVSKTLEIEGGHRDFLCAAELPDGRYLYVAQSNGVILSDRDIIGTAEDVRGHMLNDISIGKHWEYILAPMLWGIPNSSERSFEDLLPRRNGTIYYKHSWWKLAPVKKGFFGLPQRAKILVATAGVALVVGWISYDAIKKQVMAVAPKKMQNLPPPPPPPPPWKSMPLPGKLIEGCMSVINTTVPGASAANWIPESIVCSHQSGSAQLSWRKPSGGAWIQHLISLYPNAILSPDGNKATLNIPVKIEPNSAGAEPLVETVDQAILRYRIQAEAMGLKIEIAPPQQSQPLPGDNQVQIPMPQWKELVWTVKAQSISPYLLSDAFTAPGMRVLSVKALFRNGQILWELEGRQYVQ